MTTLYILRHGQSEWNVLNKVQGQENTQLTEEGVRQAHKAAERLIGENIDMIYSSDLSRAHDTAKIVADKLNLEVETLCGIREINFGIWQGLDLETIKKDHGDHYNLWRTEPHRLSLEKGETLSIVQERVLKDTNRLVSENPGKKILLVSHGTAIKTLILGLLDIDISKYNKITIGNTGISIIEFREFSPVLKLLNDCNHLRED